MILLAITNTQTIMLVVLGLFIVALIGWLIIRLAKNKMEKELDLVSVEAMLNNDDSPVVKHIDSKDEFDIEDVLEEEQELELESKQQEEPLSEIEAVLAKMKNDLDKEKVSAISTFEEEQEEKSIISYQELKAAKDKIVPYQDELEENQIVHPVNSDIEEFVDDYEEPVLEIPKVISKSKPNHFSTSEFISPVYGRLEEKKLDYPTIPSFKDDIDKLMDEQEEFVYEPLTVDYESEPISVPKYNQSNVNNDYIDVKKNQEFLNELKSFRDNLE